MTIKAQDIFGAAPKTVLNKPYMQVKDVQPSGTEGGTSVSSGTQKRNLNSVITNSISGASLTDSKVSLPAGTYYVEARTTAFRSGRTKVYLTDGSVNYLEGQSQFVDNTANHCTLKPTLAGNIILTATTEIYVNLYTEVAYSTQGLGVAADSGEEIYTEINIWKLDSSVEYVTIDPADYALNKPMLQVTQNPKTIGSTLNSFTDRVWDNVLVNDISGASVSGASITLPAGKYYVETVGFTNSTLGDYIEIQKVSDSSTLVGGTYAYASTSSVHGIHNQTSGEFTLTETTAVKVAHYAQATTSTGFGQTGDPAGHSEARFWKLDALYTTPVLDDSSMVAARPLFHAQDQKATTVDGGASSVGFNDRDINTVLTNEISGASLSSNEFTLPAGTYYIDATSPAFDTNRSRLVLRDSSDTNILLGRSDYALNSQINAELKGKFTLSATTTLKLSLYTSTAVATNGLGVAVDDGPVEIYTDVRVWQLDALRQTPVILENKLYPLPANTFVVNQMYGLDMEKTGASQVTVQPGICMDSVNTTVLDLPSSQAVTIGTTINEVYNLFLCDDQTVRTDTDVNGSNLSSYKTRWIGFALTDSSGEVVDFKLTGDRYSFLDYQNSSIGTISNTSFSGTTDMSAFFPVSKVKAWSFIGAKVGTNNSSLLVYSTDGVNDVDRICRCSTTSTSTLTQTDYTHLCAFKEPVYFKRVNGNLDPSLKDLILKR